MRTGLTFAALAMSFLASACGKGPEQVVRTPGTPATERSAAPVANLETAPQTYKRMRFVSDIEQSGSRAPVTSPRRANHLVTASTSAPSPDRFAALASRPTVASATASTLAVTPSPVGVVAIAVSEPAPMPSVPVSDYLDHTGDRYAGLGSHVVIRGGRAGDDKCDPRTDARIAGLLDGRPDSRMPLMPSKSVFGGAHR